MLRAKEKQGHQWVGEKGTEWETDVKRHSYAAHTCHTYAHTGSQIYHDQCPVCFLEIKWSLIFLH